VFDFDEKTSKPLGIIAKGSSEGIMKVEANGTLLYGKPVAGES